ncbi:hypothetical protein [Streptomyces murinus]|uniref:Uncharacterized protein n=1 Tax=Streptomyces murinus TaxID=33900 RepID=A0A7W3NK90_STRMR|nr:hypothetical protein [Streptomyces murinus]MBA9052087.1 hypothetical protein [Streptomyces murinus]
MLHAELAALAADGSRRWQPPIQPYLNHVAVRRRTLDHPGDAHDWPSRMHLEMALQFNTWLSHYDIERAI